MPASVLWELSLGADRRPLRAWGLRGATLTRRSFGGEELRLEAPGLALSAAVLFPTGASVVLWRNGARWFTGRITSPEVYGSRSREGHTYVASGPWWFLENLTYQEARYMASDPSDADSPLEVVTSPRAVLFNTLEGGQQTAGQQIGEALAYANTRGAGILAGAIGLTAQPPWEEATAISCAEVIKRAARYTPDAAQWWDHAPAKPTFRAARRSALPALTLDLAAADRVEELAEIRPIPGIPGVRFFYEDFVQLPDGKTRARYAVQSAGNPDAAEAINEVVELGGQGGDNPEPIPSDLVAEVWSALSATTYSGSLRLRGRDVVGELAPGKVLNLANGRAEWAAMRALVQSVQADLFSGVEQVAFGPATFLGAGQLAEFLRYARLTKKTSYLDSRRTGEGSTSAVSPRSILFNGTQFGSTELELCDSAGGTPRRIKIFSEILEAGGPAPSP